MATDGDGMPTEREILEGLRCPHDGFDPRFCDICMDETPARMKFLTLHQPWASLIALGVKTIETRSWSTKYRGPLAIHAGLREPSRDEMLLIDGHDQPRMLPLGALVAVCDLVDVVPIQEADQEERGPCIVHGRKRPPHYVSCAPYPALVRVDDPLEEAVDVSDQLPFGDFTPGRYAWLLDNVRALPKPIPMKGAQGLRDLSAAIEMAVAAQLGVDA